MKALPEILINSLEGVRGFDEKAFIQAHEQSAATSVRLNPLKPSAAFSDAAAVPWSSYGRYLSQRPVFTTDPLFHAGAYYVQEASSMFLEYMLTELLPDKGNLRVLDLCAAPGGKSTLIASLLEDSSLLISNEVIRSRAGILEENMTRWGQMNTWVTSNDPKDLGRLNGYFDVIVVDAPCSGSGLFRKDERALNEWSEANVTLCAQRQQRILADIWPALKQGGILIYATCSYSQQEDEDILSWLDSNYQVEGLNVAIKEEWGIVETSAEGTDLSGYRFFPDKVNGEGFFIAAMKKDEEHASAKPVKYRSMHDAKAYGQCRHLLAVQNELTCFETKDGYNVVRADHEQDWNRLKGKVYIRKVGIELGAPVKKSWLPAHDVALSVERNPDLLYIDVNKEQALKFLKKEDIGVNDLVKDWYIVRFEGLGLGWVKALGNRINNYLPKNWRIRMDITDADWA